MKLMDLRARQIECVGRVGRVPAHLRGRLIEMPVRGPICRLLFRGDLTCSIWPMPRIRYELLSSLRVGVLLLDVANSKFCLRLCQFVPLALSPLIVLCIALLLFCHTSLILLDFFSTF